MEERIANPYGANANVSDPREQVMWGIYVGRGLENAYQSAIDAGYSESSALNITTRDWFVERLGKLRRKDMLSKAEKVLQKTLTYEPMDSEGNINTPLLAVQNKTAQFVAERLNKAHYSTRSEVTGADGGKLEFNIVNYADTNTPQVSTEELSDTITESAG